MSTEKKEVTRAVILEGKTVPYTLERKSVKNVNMRISETGELLVSASPHMSIAQIEEILMKNARTICRGLEKAQERATRLKSPQYPVHYVTGECVLYLGEWFTLVVCAGQKAVKIVGKEMRLSVPIITNDRARVGTFDAWWRAKTAKVIESIAQEIYPIYQEKGVNYPTFNYRKMRAQWGNCRPKTGVLTFNIRLLAAPERCIRYVVIHEFTHFLYPDHSRDFYRFVSDMMANYREVQRELNSIVETHI